MTSYYCVTEESGYCYDRDELYTTTYLVVEGEASPEALDVVASLFYDEEMEFLCSLEDYRHMVEDSGFYVSEEGVTYYEVAYNR